ncbi:hypothetical protein QVD17_02610 [Tagetes erecta]|uniref:F-box domain-containing protein n=1 Tax=Tagetes erecta TaxID=13708 RepID=A0AAD8LD36_TARER|nr:hypothetical protein QVD17_02610 [Tagetes erecta]
MVVEILSRLPPKSLLRFRTVSKSVYTCIGSPRFIRLHTLRSPKKFMIIHQELDTKIIYYSIHSESSYDGITPFDSPFRCTTTCLVGSCNGILCFYDRKSRAIHLWNPAIRRKAIVPDTSDAYGDYCLEFGFGFDMVNDDYKILRTSKQATFVYTMKTRTWRQIASPATLYSSATTSHFLFNGSLYRIVEEDLEHNYCRYIMTFDLSSEVFSTIELPLEPSCKASELTSIKGCLAVTYIQVDGDVWIWARNATDASWYVAFKLNTHERTTLGDLLFSRYSNGIIVFNPNSGARSTLAPFNHSSRILTMITCIESLELLNTGTTCSDDQTNCKTDVDLCKTNKTDDDDLCNLGCCVIS